MNFFSSPIFHRISPTWMSSYPYFALEFPPTGVLTGVSTAFRRLLIARDLMLWRKEFRRAQIKSFSFVSFSNNPNLLFKRQKPKKREREKEKNYIYFFWDSLVLMQTSYFSFQFSVCIKAKQAAGIHSHCSIYTCWIFIPPEFSVRIKVCILYSSSGCIVALGDMSP